jgi:cell division septation protein DedD
MSSRALPLLAALLLGVSAAFLVACGAGAKRGVPAADAQQLDDDLDALKAAVSNGECAKAEAAVVKVKGDILQLPATVSPKLRKRLTSGANNLSARAGVECAKNAQTTTTETTPTDTTPTDTTPTDTTPTDTTPTDTTPTDTTPTDTTPTDTTPTDTTPTTTTTTPGGGGTGGVTPGGQGKGNGKGNGNGNGNGTGETP